MAVVGGARPRRADAAAIAGVDVRAWWHAYGAFLDEQRLSGAHASSMRTARWREILAGERQSETLGARGRGPDRRLRVASGAARRGRRPRGRGEIYALYVDPPAQGAGAGTRLLAARRRSGFASCGFEQATLWTFEDNGLARAFYERHGWELDEPHRDLGATASAGRPRCATGERCPAGRRA